jgi:predicted nucleic acid-binding Zn finger protein
MRNMPLPSKETKMLGKEELTQSDIEYFRSKYGKRFVRALRAVEEGRVLEYLFNPSETTKWIVRGKRREYLVIPGVFCTCRSFYHSVVIEREVQMCYHLLAQAIAETRNQQRRVESTDAERREMSAELRRTD